ncbi:MAG: hypothetical protein AMXMBFR56_72830 [Polyangiaceae bacterium]
MRCSCPPGEALPVSRWWAEYTAQNHRAPCGELVCSGCGGGIPASAEEQARVEAADRAYEEKEAKARAGR